VELTDPSALLPVQNRFVAAKTQFGEKHIFKKRAPSRKIANIPRKHPDFRPVFRRVGQDGINHGTHGVTERMIP